MRYSTEVILKVKELRRSGYTLDQIQTKTNLPRTTIYDWIRSINLTKAQTEKIKEVSLAKLQQGRIIKQQIYKNKIHELQSRYYKAAIGQIGKLNIREKLLIGIALYWAEGFKNKHEHRIGFCNTDPEMILFYINWLKIIGVSATQISARVTVNESYKNDVNRIEEYWSKLTKIPLNQFTKPFFQKTKWLKKYNNDNYYGVLRIHVNKSFKEIQLMKGWIQGLKLNLS